MGHRDRIRPGRRRRVGWIVVAVAVALTAAVGTAAVALGNGSASAPAGLAYGVLGSRCDPARATALHGSGVRYAEVELSWALFEPAPGSVDPSYAAQVQRSVRQCRGAGLGVVLTLGLHAAPRWVTDLPDGTYRDQYGDRGPDDVPNVVFSAAVRTAVSRYLAELDRVVPFSSLAAIRVGTGTHGELGYPASDATGASPLWAFDGAAQTGAGLAAGAAVDPMPGWNPGSRDWRGSAVSTDAVRAWFQWYSQSVADAALWIIAALRRQGFTGAVHLPLAGRGALPGDLAEALADRLDGTGDRDGSLEAGLYYPDQLPYIAQHLARTEQPGWGAVSADSTSLDDATAVAARSLNPPEDTCRTQDAHLDLVRQPGTENWSSFRWTIAVARQAGLPVIGENPGSPDTPGTGGNAQTDDSAQQLRRAPRYAHDCGLSLFLWAFEDDLFGGGGIAVRDLASAIAAVEAQPRRTQRAGLVR